MKDFPLFSYSPFYFSARGNFGRIKGKWTVEWLERLTVLGAPADILSNVQAILRSEQGNFLENNPLRVLKCLLIKLSTTLAK